MKSWIDENSDLNVRILKGDISALLSRETITQQTSNQKLRKEGMVQITLKLDDLQKSMEIKKSESSKGYDITLDRKTFQRHIEEGDKNPASEDCPFWGRGIQYGLPLDRIHIHYVPV